MCLDGLKRMHALQIHQPNLQAVFLNVLDHVPPEQTAAYVSPFAGVTGYTPDTSQRTAVLQALGARLDRDQHNEIIHSDEIYQLHRSSVNEPWRLVLVHPAPIM